MCVRSLRENASVAVQNDAEYRFCRRAPLLAMIQPPRALPFNTMQPALIYMPTLLITPNSRSQKHLHVILSR